MIDAGANGTRGTVLVVEDHSVSRAALRKYLEIEGYRVLDVACGAEALAIVRDGSHADALLVDFALPDMKGDALVDELRTVLPDIGVIFMSGYSQKEVAPGVHRYLAKPLDINVVLKTLAELLGIGR